MKKFSCAFNGLKEALKEKAVLTQCVLALLAILGGLIIKLDHYEWLAFVICIALVIGFEIINSVIEKLCDLYSLDKNENIRIIKDMAAGAVLVVSIGALLVCILCLIRRI